MKKIYIFFIVFLNLSNFIFSHETYYNSWKDKTLKEKQNYIIGLLDGIHELGYDLDINISKFEKNNEIDSELANKIEIPVIVGTFLYVNANTNGINSLIEYIDDRYRVLEFREFSVYQILINKSKIEVQKYEDFQWISEE